MQLSAVQTEYADDVKKIISRPSADRLLREATATATSSMGEAGPPEELAPQPWRHLPVSFDKRNGKLSFADADYSGESSSSAPAAVPRFLDWLGLADSSKPPTKTFSFLTGMDTRVIRADEDVASGGVFLSFEMEDRKSQHDVILGRLPEGAKMLAFSRIKRWWMAPSWCNSADEVPVETQLLLVEVPDGRYVVIAPLIDFDRSFRQTIFGGKEGGAPAGNGLLAVRCESGDPAVQHADIDNGMFIAAGTDPYDLMEVAFQSISKRMGTFRTYAQKPSPAGIDEFGFCTWDAFYSSVDADKVKAGLQSLRDSGTPPKFVIIDDGWQSTSLSGEQTKKVKSKAKVASSPSSSSDSHVSSAHAASGSATDDGELSGAQIDGSLAAQKMKEGGNPIIAVVTNAVGSFYNNHVEKGAPGSLAVKLWVALSQTVLKEKLTRFFAEQTDFSKRLTSWKANSKFEDSARGSSLKSFVGDLKSQLGVRHVFVWHALAGYWGGVSEEVGDDLNAALSSADSTAPAVIRSFSQPSPHLLLVEPALAWDPGSLVGVGSVAKEKLEKMYHAMHSYLAEAGVDGVKVDAQAGIGTFGAGNGGGAALARAAVRAVEESVKAAFAPAAPLVDVDDYGELQAAKLDAVAVAGPVVDARGVSRLLGSPLRRARAMWSRTRQDLPATISPMRLSDTPVALVGCMCHSTENLYSYFETGLVRASDDFYPKDLPAQTCHIVSCAYNSVMLSQIGTCDWDMFHSKHSHAEMHAAARAVSGGPIYVSDSPGVHDAALLRRLVLSNGQILRAVKPAKPTVDCLFRNPTNDWTTALKIFAPNRVGGVFGVFNTQGASWSRTQRKYCFHPASPPLVSTDVRPRDAIASEQVFGPDPFLVGLDPKAARALGHGRQPTDRFVAWSARQRRVEVLEGRGAAMTLVLEKAGWDVITMHRVLQLGADARSYNPQPQPQPQQKEQEQQKQDESEEIVGAVEASSSSSSSSSEQNPGLGQGLLGLLKSPLVGAYNYIARPLLRPWVAALQLIRTQRPPRRAGGDRVQWAPLGLIELLNCGAAVAEVLPSKTAREGTFIGLGEGLFGVYANSVPREVRVGTEAVMFDYSDRKQLVTFQLPPSSPPLVAVAASAGASEETGRTGGSAVCVPPPGRRPTQGECIAGHKVVLQW